MIEIRSFRYRVYPTNEQTERLCAWDGALRFLWNIALEQRLMGLARPRTDRRYPTAFDQMRELTELRAALPWLADVPRNVCSQVLVRLDGAWRRCFARASMAPRWKRKGVDAVSFREPHKDLWRMDVRSIRFPKLGGLRAVIHRPIQGQPKACTIVRDGDQWFACVDCEIERPDPLHRIGPVVAIDRGSVNAVADSDGRLVPSPRFYEVAMRRLARAQRSVSRKKKGSKNREKAKVRVMRLHRKVRRQRDHFLHVLSCGYAKSHGVVVIEKLMTKQMTKSASGTSDAPGRNVRQKSGLNRGILDAGWHKFAAMLRYKLAWSGGSLVEVPAAYSSQTCCLCGSIDARSRKSQTEFACTSCGHTDHADLNAAQILKLRAAESAVTGCGGCAALGRPKKQQLRVARRAGMSGALLRPTEITQLDDGIGTGEVKP